MGWAMVRSPVRVHVSRSFFSDYPTGASLIRVSTFFVFLALFSRAGAGRILCLHRVSLQEETGGRTGKRGREDSGHCGTICTKVAIAMEFKGAEEWRPMQIEAFFFPPLAGEYNIHELFAKNGPTLSLIEKETLKTTKHLVLFFVKS